MAQNNLEEPPMKGTFYENYTLPYSFLLTLESPET